MHVLGVCPLVSVFVYCVVIVFWCHATALYAADRCLREGQQSNIYTVGKGGVCFVCRASLPVWRRRRCRHRRRLRFFLRFSRPWHKRKLCRLDRNSLKCIHVQEVTCDTELRFFFIAFLHCAIVRCFLRPICTSQSRQFVRVLAGIRESAGMLGVELYSLPTALFVAVSI